MWYIHTVGYYSALIKPETPTIYDKMNKFGIQCSNQIIPMKQDYLPSTTCGESEDMRRK